MRLAGSRSPTAALAGALLTEGAALCSTRAAAPLERALSRLAASGGATCRSTSVGAGTAHAGRALALG
jgi:hypothetical protein